MINTFFSNARNFTDPDAIDFWLRGAFGAQLLAFREGNAFVEGLPSPIGVLPMDWSPGDAVRTSLSLARLPESAWEETLPLYLFVASYSTPGRYPSNGFVFSVGNIGFGAEYANSSSDDSVLKQRLDAVDIHPVKSAQVSFLWRCAVGLEIESPFTEASRIHEDDAQIFLERKSTPPKWHDLIVRGWGRMGLWLHADSGALLGCSLSHHDRQELRIGAKELADARDIVLAENVLRKAGRVVTNPLATNPVSHPDTSLLS
jgi:hypothetical protein